MTAYPKEWTYFFLKTCFPSLEFRIWKAQQLRSRRCKERERERGVFGLTKKNQVHVLRISIEKILSFKFCSCQAHCVYFYTEARRNIGHYKIKYILSPRAFLILHKQNQPKSSKKKNKLNTYFIKSMYKVVAKIISFQNLSLFNMSMH